MRFALLHSPFLTRASWGEVPALLEKSGHDVFLFDGEEATTPREYAKAAQLQLPVEPTVLVAHSGAGPLVPIVAARREGGILGAIFVDASLPAVTGESRLATLQRRRPEVAAELARHLYAGGSYPDPADPAWSGAELRPRGLAFFTEPVPLPSSTWNDLRWAYFRTSAAYDEELATATGQLRPVLSADLGHLAPLTAPAETASGVEDLAAALA